MATPKWFSALSDALTKSPGSGIYTLATVNTSASPPIPRVRSIAHRAFISPTPDIPLLVSTTDVRTSKVHELTSISTQSQSPTRNAEIVWWFPGELNEQYRFSGTVHILPSPSPEHAELLKRFPRERLAPILDENGKMFDWEGERMRVFNEKMGGVLRASFARPIPGSPLDRYEDAEKWPAKLPKTTELDGVDQETRESVEFALGNFSLMVMEPVTVERVQLAVVPNRRTQWERMDREWKERIVVP